MYLLFVYRGTRNPFRGIATSFQISNDPDVIVKEIKVVEEEAAHAVMVVYRFDTVTNETIASALTGGEKASAIMLIQSNERHPNLWKVFTLKSDTPLQHAGWKAKGIGQESSDGMGIPWN